MNITCIRSTCIESHNDVENEMCRMFESKKSSKILFAVRKSLFR